MSVKLSSYSAVGFDRGASKIKECLWLLTSFLVFRLLPFSASALKRSILRAFGARVGVGVIIKPMVKITFPWKLTLGDYVWLGEECWLLNLVEIVIEDHVCISQRAFVCTGSHDYNAPHFNLIVRPVRIREGAWIGANSWVGPGVTIGTHSVLSAGSVTGKDLSDYGIYRGNPCIFQKRRTLFGQSPAGITDSNK